MSAAVGLCAPLRAQHDLGTFLGVGARAQACSGAGPELRATLRSHSGFGVVGLPLPVVLGSVIWYISYVTLKETPEHRDCSFACSAQSWEHF